MQPTFKIRRSTAQTLHTRNGKREDIARLLLRIKYESSYTSKDVCNRKLHSPYSCIYLYSRRKRYIQVQSRVKQRITTEKAPRLMHSGANQRGLSTKLKSPQESKMVDSPKSHTFTEGFSSFSSSYTVHHEQ